MSENIEDQDPGSEVDNKQLEVCELQDQHIVFSHYLHFECWHPLPSGPPFHLKGYD